MSLLNDKSIELNCEEIGLVKPFVKENLQPNSLDLRLGDEYLVDCSFETFNILPEKLLMPGDFILGTTMETVNIPRNLAGRVEGKSSTGRIGLMVHSTAGFIDAGFCGQITLELKNISNKPIMLHSGTPICQITFELLVDEPSKLYGDCDNHYQGQCGVQASKYPLVDGVYHVTDKKVQEDQTTLGDF